MFLLILLEGLDQYLLGQSLDKYGIIPRDTEQLWGILAAPLLHGGFEHLFANLTALVLLTVGLVLSAPRDSFFAVVVSWILGGFGVWLFGSPGVHIGASGVVYGLIGFLFLRGLVTCIYGTLWAGFFTLIISVVVGVVFWSAIPGMFPGMPQVSWEGHLFGFLSGGLAAFVVARVRGSKSDV